MVKASSTVMDTLGGIKALPGISTRFRHNGFMKKSSRTLGHGDFYEDRVAVIKVSGFLDL
jgi:hypothetical protein